MPDNKDRKVTAMKTRGILYSLILLLAVSSITGCGTAGYLEKPTEDGGESIVVGYIDMGDAPTKLQWVSMKQLKPRIKKPFYNFYVDEGMFYRGHVRDGVFKFDSFGGHSSWGNTTYTFNFPAQGKGSLDREIKKPGVYFVGSYRYKKVKTGFFKPSEFDLEKIDSPTEKEVLERLLKWTIKQPKWKAMVEQRLKEIK
jgi:hypothetical protein